MGRAPGGQVSYARSKHPEPTIVSPLRVQLAPSRGGFAARAKGDKDALLGFKHVCKAFGGDSVPGGWAFPFRMFADLVDYLSGQDGVAITPAPELRPHLMRVAHELEGDLERLAERVAGMPHQLYPYQVDGAEYLVTDPRAALFDEMGLGKTVQILAALPDEAATLVVCPASLRLTWAKEIARWRPDLAPVLARAVNDIRNPKPGEAVICSPEGLIRAVAQLGDSETTLVVDEAHYYKNSEARRTKVLAGVANRCGRVWIATGTPMTNRPPDLLGVLRTFGLFDRAWPTRRYFDIAFGIRFDKKTQTVDWPSKPDHPDAIVRALGRVAIRRRREEVLPEIPAKTYAEIHVDLRDSKVAIPEDTSATQAIYKVADKGGLEVLPFGGYDSFSEIRAALAEAKIPQMLEVVDRFRELGLSLVVGSSNLAPLEALADRGFPTITGSVTPEKRQAHVEAFQARDELILGVQTQAGGTGLTLTAAHHMLMVQREWTPAANQQLEDRICRIGQANACVIYDLLANHPLDEIISRSVRDKQDRIDLTVNRVTSDLTRGHRLVNRLRELAGFMEQ